MKENVKSDSKKRIGLMIVLLGVVLIAGGFIYASMGTNTFKSKEESEKKDDSENKNEEESIDDVAYEFEGIYAASNDKLYIRVVDYNKLNYVIAETFHGTAEIIDETTARQEGNPDDNKYFEFKLVNGGVEVSYHTDDNTTASLETGLYKKIAAYSRDSLYREAVGDPLYINFASAGLYASDDGIEIYVIPISGNDLRVLLKNNDKTSGMLFDENFAFSHDGKAISYSSTNKNEIDYEMEFFIRKTDDKDFNLIVHDSAIDNKILESKYKYIKAITIDDVIDEFYSNY